MILLDTSGLLAALFPDQRRHEECVRALLAAAPPLLLSPFVLAELNYLVGRLRGNEARAALAAEVARGAYSLVTVTPDDVRQARDVMLRFADLEVGLADASLVVLSLHSRTHDILTLDERHFRVLTGHEDKHFRLLPADG